MPHSLGIILLSGSHERAHFAFMLAAAAAAMGREVTLFASNAGCHALLTDWSGLEGAAEDASLIRKGIAGFAELRDACIELNVTLLACETGLARQDISDTQLHPAAKPTGLATLLASQTGQLVTL